MDTYMDCCKWYGGDCGDCFTVGGNIPQCFEANGIFKVYELTPNDFNGSTDKRDDEIVWVVAKEPPIALGFYATEINIPLDSAGIDYVKET